VAYISGDSGVSQDSPRKFGKYEIVEELGRGAMGVVYKARDPLIGRMVALKTVMPGLLSDQDLLKRFYREAQSAGRLQHPNIVIIHDLGESDGLPYIAMELVEGESLQKIIARKVALPLATKLTILVQICRALGYAHQHGIVHRDVKPANILVKPDGTIKVVDFGIVHLADTGMTSSGMILGTVSYMAPEQLRGEAVDARSDIFAVGAVMYELLSYRKAFDGANITAIMFKIASGEPTPLPQVVPGIPHALDEAVRRCLRKDREDRFQSLEDLVFELEPLARAAQREVVDSLVEQGRGLLKQQDFVGAEEVLRSALELDSSDERAKGLMLKVQAELKHLRGTPRIKECLKEGRSWLEQGKYLEASQAFEEILRLNSHHGQAHELLRQAREALAKADEVRKKLEVARRALNQGELTVAEAEANETLQIDPDQIEAARLLEQVRKKRVMTGKPVWPTGTPVAIPGQATPPHGADQAGAADGRIELERSAMPQVIHTRQREEPQGDAQEAIEPVRDQHHSQSKRRTLMLVAALIVVATLSGVGYMIWRSVSRPMAYSAQPSGAPAVAAGTMGTLEGHVTGPGNSEVAGVQIEVSDVSGKVTQTTSAADGSFRLGNLKAGSYSVKAEPPSGYSAPSDVNVEVSGSQKQQVNLSLSKLASTAAVQPVESATQVSKTAVPASERVRSKPPEQQIKLPDRSDSSQPGPAVPGGTGGLDVTANVDGARIIIDGHDTGEVTPHDFANVSAGPHTVTLIKDGYGTAVRQFSVPPGATAPANLQLPVPVGELVLTTVPAGADVTIDGKNFGKSPVHATLRAGNHQCKITLGSTSKESAIEILANTTTTSKFDFPQ
jgi:serine/threonine protein kinase